MNDGTWVASNIDLARNLAENALDSYDWTGDLGIETAGHVWYGSTLAEASKTAAAGVAPAFTEESLRETIEKYNSYVEDQKDPDFGKGVLAGALVNVHFLKYSEETGNSK